MVGHDTGFGRTLVIVMVGSRATEPGDARRTATCRVGRVLLAARQPGCRLPPLTFFPTRKTKVRERYRRHTMGTPRHSMPRVAALPRHAESHKHIESERHSTRLSLRCERHGSWPSSLQSDRDTATQGWLSHSVGRLHQGAVGRRRREGKRWNPCRAARRRANSRGGAAMAGGLLVTRQASYKSTARRPWPLFAAAEPQRQPWIPGDTVTGPAAVQIFASRTCCRPTLIFAPFLFFFPFFPRGSCIMNASPPTTRR